MCSHPRAEREAAEVLKGRRTICDCWAQELLKKQLPGVELPVIDSLTERTQLTIHQGFPFCQSTLALQTYIRYTSYHNDWNFVNVCKRVCVRVCASPLKWRFPFLLRLTASALFFKSWMLCRSRHHTSPVSLLSPSSLHIIWISDYLFSVLAN